MTWPVIYHATYHSILVSLYGTAVDCSGFHRHKCSIDVDGEVSLQVYYLFIDKFKIKRKQDGK